ncbi:MAG: NAD(P)H-hydrate dehydratase, partial [Acidobacteriota bacterium]
MAEVDRRAIDELGIPGAVLMEHAALGAVDAIGERFPGATRVAIYCGPGNNGGDGYAMARLLDARGYAVDIFRVGRRPGGDALLQLEILERSGHEAVHIEDSASLDAALGRGAAADLAVDALFGAGLSRPLEGRPATLVQGLRKLPTPLLAVDLPSGLDASRSTPIGPFAAADLTVTFAAPKVAHVLAPACDAMGEVVLVDLGIPAMLVAEAPGSWHLLTREDAASLVIEGDASAHKGSFGHTLVIAGSRGMSGAAILAVRAAVRGGAGLTTAAVPRALVDVVEASSFESMTVGLGAPGLGGSEHLGADDVDRLLDAASGKASCVLGPGLGRAPSTGHAVRQLVERLETPLVLDADGLFALGTDVTALKARRAPAILTPHPGEMARLLGTDAAAVEADRPAAALELASRSGQIAVLKGRRTLVASPDGELWINPTGNAGMATGGSGDVLAGLLGALLAQGYDASAAAGLGVYLHGLAGDLAAETSGRPALAAGDLIAS